MSEALREENALMSYGFLFPKACGGVGTFGCLSFFASNKGFHFSVGRTEVRPTSLRMAVFTPAIFPADLLRGENPMNWWMDSIMRWLPKKCILNIFSSNRSPKEKRWMALCCLPLFISQIILLNVWWRCKPLSFFMFIYAFIISSKYQNFSSCVLFTV